MKIAVLVKQTPDSAELLKVSADDVNRGLVETTMTINPWDEHAVEEAVRLRREPRVDAPVEFACAVVLVDYLADKVFVFGHSRSSQFVVRGTIYII